MALLPIPIFPLTFNETVIYSKVIFSYASPFLPLFLNRVYHLCSVNAQM